MNTGSTKNMAENYIIGITGRSGCGKSTLSRNIQKAIKSSVLIELDSYFYKSSEFNCESPSESEILAFEKFSAAIESLKFGQESVEWQVFDCHTASFLNKRVTIHSAPLMIIDGLLTLWYDKLRSLMDLTVFIDVPDDICLSRRIERRLGSMREGTPAQGRKAIIDRWEIISKQWDESLQQTIKYADLTITHPEDGTSKVLSMLAHKDII